MTLEEAANAVVEANAAYYNAKGSYMEIGQLPREIKTLVHKREAALNALEEVVLTARDESTKHSDYVTAQKERRDKEDARSGVDPIVKARAVWTDELRGARPVA